MLFLCEPPIVGSHPLITIYDLYFYKSTMLVLQVLVISQWITTQCMLTLQSSVLQGSENQSSGTNSKKSGDGSKRSLSPLMLHSALLKIPPAEQKEKHSALFMEKHRWNLWCWTDFHSPCKTTGSFTKSNAMFKRLEKTIWICLTRIWIRAHSGISKLSNWAINHWLLC